MRIKADLYSGRLFEYWEPKKRDRQTLPVMTTMMGGDIVTKTKNIRVGTRPVPVDGFYEWNKVVGGKIPYSISMDNRNAIGFRISVNATAKAARQAHQVCVVQRLLRSGQGLSFYDTPRSRNGYQERALA
jgi:hypothetical protein